MNTTKKMLIEEAKKWDELQNEGGDGYNPYRDQLEELEAEEAKPKKRYASAVLAEIEEETHPIKKEMGLYNQAKVDALYKELEEIDARSRAAGYKVMR